MSENEQNQGLLLVDLTDVDDGSAIEPAIYTAAVFEAIQKQSSNGKPMLVIAFRLSDPPYETRKVYRNYVLEPQSLWALKQCLRALGFGDDELSGQLNLSLADLVGMPCRVNVRNREWEGVMRNDVKGVLPADTESSALQSMLTA